MNLRVLAGLFAIMPLLVPLASADIVGIQAIQGCTDFGLPTTSTVTGGTYCTTGGDGFSLTAILNGTIALPVADSKTPDYDILNDTGAPLTSLTLFFFGALASNANIDMQTRNPFMHWKCTSVDAHGGTHSDANCGTGDITVDNPALPLKLTWSGGTAFGTGVGTTGNTFNLWTASFAHSGQDTGSFNGPVPDGGVTLMLLGGALAGLETLRRRFRV